MSWLRRRQPDYVQEDTIGMIPGGESGDMHRLCTCARNGRTNQWALNEHIVSLTEALFLIFLT
jgi:hypothetical protein